MPTKTLDWSTVEDLIQSAEQGSGVVGVTIVAPDGFRFEHNGDRRFRAASTMKIPLMIAIYRQIELGTLSLGNLQVLYREGKAVGSGVLLHLHDGINLTLNDLVYLMISISDNTATNMLIDLATMPYVNEVMQSLGMANSTLGRKMQGKPAEG
ncbi:MAG TPA: serine hydrolase, partial [Thermomicrobiaceae bacterium]|nr:serine hydrolase [Thermomicrobiaceae bacterium]